jgi:hypothetical protein
LFGGHESLINRQGKGRETERVFRSVGCKGRFLSLYESIGVTVLLVQFVIVSYNAQMNLRLRQAYERKSLDRVIPGTSGVHAELNEKARYVLGNLSVTSTSWFPLVFNGTDCPVTPSELQQKRKQLLD